MKTFLKATLVKQGQINLKHCWQEANKGVRWQSDAISEEWSPKLFDMCCVQQSDALKGSEQWSLWAPTPPHSQVRVKFHLGGNKRVGVALCSPLTRKVNKSRRRSSWQISDGNWNSISHLTQRYGSN